MFFGKKEVRGCLVVRRLFAFLYRLRNNVKNKI